MASINDGRRLTTRLHRMLIVAVVIVAGCDGARSESGSSDGNPTQESASAEASRRSAVLFRDVTDEVGIDFVHFIGATGNYYFPEIMGAGVALLDFDNDGDLDIYALQGAMVLPDESIDQSIFPPQCPLPPRNRLYRNDLVVEPDGTRRLRFTDVTAESGVGDLGYAMGCAVGDYDNDGDDDIYVTNHGSNVLLRNNGDGTFSDVTVAAGVDDSRWSTSAAFVDYDNDGSLDLYVANYAAFTDDVYRVCRSPSGDRAYCAPVVYRGVSDSLFHNLGDGTFENVSESSGIASTDGHGLGVTGADFDRDGRIDIYVANDGDANHLWHNRGDGTFQDIALLAGTALNGDGTPEAGMGVTVADFDGDGDEDIFIAHLLGETNTLYVNQGNGMFDDATFRLKLGHPGRQMTGFGTHFFDYDNDGRLDLVVVNGAVAKLPSQTGQPHPYLMANQLFRGTASGDFEDVSTQAGPAFAMLESSRGLAVGDLDLDGGVDLVVANNNGRLRVLRNEVAHRGHWLRAKVVATSGNRGGIGALVSMSQGDETIIARVHTDSSYCSASDASTCFGLGSNTAAITLTVRWPGGEQERWSNIQVDSTVTLQQGSGTILP
ncbi:MAG: CRTAC1 family protein [Phycisphaerales bacterium]